MSRPYGFFRLHELVAIVAFVAVAAGLLLLPRCVEKGTVTGKVSVNGKPISEGWITFFDRENHEYRGFIQRDGYYSVSDIPRGTVKIAVVMKKRISPGFGEPTTDPSAPSSYVPRRYSDPDTSGLSLMVWAGLQERHIDLQDDFTPSELGE
jgi:hypothetical protein